MTRLLARFIRWLDARSHEWGFPQAWICDLLDISYGREMRGTRLNRLATSYFRR